MNHPTIPITPELQDLLDRLFAWSYTTFGPSEDGYGCAAHLAKEAEEVKDNPSDILEWADCFMLLVDGARRSGYSFQELMEAVEHKFAICQTRKWLPPNAEGVIEHDRQHSL